MAHATTSLPATGFAGDFDVLARSFTLSLQALNRAPTTIDGYNKAIRYLDRFLADRGMPRLMAHIRREHVEAFLADVLTRGAPASAANYYRSLQQFFKWCEDEGEVERTPMARMRPPHIPEEPPPVLKPEELHALLAACDGRGFFERRDRALVMLLIDTGMRRAELAGLRVADVDLTMQTATVLGKGRRPRACPFGHKTAQALDRYLRSRASQAQAGLEWLWLGREGRLTDWGIDQAVERRAVQAGLGKVNLHRFRHTAAHMWLLAGGSENGAMQTFGWRSRQMLSRYGASAAAERAREEHRRLSPADKL